MELNRKNKYGNYPLLEAVSSKNIEIIKLLIEYANKYKIILKVNEKNFEIFKISLFNYHVSNKDYEKYIHF